MLNKAVVKFALSKEKQKVGRGECWDLAAEALDKAGAKWDHHFEFGKLIDPKKGDCLSPGDIFQFEKVHLSYDTEKSHYEESYEHHTAILVKINPDGSMMMAQQNTSDHGKKVSIDSFDFKNLKSGTITIYRPHN